jgi:predicted ester cyclase
MWASVDNAAMNTAEAIFTALMIPAFIATAIYVTGWQGLNYSVQFRRSAGGFLSMLKSFRTSRQRDFRVLPNVRHPVPAASQVIDVPLSAGTGTYLEELVGLFAGLAKGAAQAFVDSWS